MAKSIMTGAVGACVLACTAPCVAQGGEEAHRLHPLESYCVEYRVSGVQSGTVTECLKAHGRQRVEIQHLEPAPGEDGLPLHHRVIHDGATVTAIDLEAGQATRVRNPDHGQLVAFVAGKDGLEIAEDFARALGGEPTGESRAVAGQACDVWDANQNGFEASWCMSPDGVLLSFRMPHMLKEATQVRIGDSGPDDFYAVPSNIVVADAQDPSALGAMLGTVQ